MHSSTGLSLLALALASVHTAHAQKPAWDTYTAWPTEWGPPPKWTPPGQPPPGHQGQAPTTTLQTVPTVPTGQPTKNTKGGQNTVPSSNVVITPNGTPVVPGPTNTKATGTKATGTTGTGPTNVAGGTSNQGANVGKICINWEGDFNWVMDGGFAKEEYGPLKGSGGKAASRCFPRTVTSAAMFLCHENCDSKSYGTNAKFTKFECTLGADANGSPNEWGNCDMSVDDGFSVPAQCSWQGKTGLETIGGTEDLLATHQCVGAEALDSGTDKTCWNSKAYGDSPDKLSDFFKASYNQNGNNYCNWHWCPAPGDPHFDGPLHSDPQWGANQWPTISCRGGLSAHQRAKRDEIFGRNETLEAREAAPEPVALESRAEELASSIKTFAKRAMHGSHGARAHARNVKLHA